MTTINNSPSAPKVYQPLSHAEVGMLVALASMAMLFGTLMLSYILARSRLPMWPPIGVELIRPFFPTLATAAIALSSIVLKFSFQAFEERQFESFRKLWLLGSILGLGFMAFQIATWQQMWALGTTLQSQLFGGMFYTLTALHAVHVLAGIAVLFFVYFKTRNINHTSKTAAPKLALWFWHFLGFVWYAMYALLVWL